MARPNDRFWNFVEKLDDGRFNCTFCGYKFAAATSVSRIKWHLSGVRGHGVAICDKVTEDVQEAAFQAMHGGNKRHKSIASSSNVNDNAISTTPQEQNNNEVDNLAGDAGTTQAPDIMGHALGRSWDEIYNFLMEDDIENGTGGVVQPGAGASSSGGLAGNTNETPGDTLPTSLHVEVDNVAPQGQHLERVTGQPVVRGSSRGRPLVNHDEPQEDYHDQLCPPLVNMVGDAGQPVVRDSSHEVLQRNGDESGRDVFLTEELIGGEFENNKNAIWSWIMNDEASSSIGIYGMGGVGKTTLLTHIYNQLLQEPGTFRHVYWITLSQDFSVYRLQNLIAKDIPLDLSNEDNERKRAAKLSKALIGKQRWVLILDDLWNCFDFDKVGIPIQVKGCKLIVTTRSLEVCQRMVCQKTIKVEPLSVEEAWALFMKVLGCIPPEVEEIAKSMARECAGLPLGIKTMAGTMRGVDDICEWRNALEELKQSRVWQEDMDEKVFHIMRFSFMYLKESELQQCFLCCALFPEDFEIPREDLIAYLIDEGVIKGLKSREAEFNKGHSMLNKLERVCLLESAKEGYYDDRCVKMHDLIRDMAIQILHENSQGMVKAGARLTEVPGAEEWTENLTRVSLMHNQIEEIPSTHSPRCPSLSTLLLCDNSQLQFIADLFFEQLHELKVLDLSRTNITKLPDSVSELVSLTTLLLSGCKMLRHVPSLEKLTALKRLDLSGTALEMMPQGMECLCNLRHLRMNGCGEKEFPRGLLPKLSHLQVFVLEWIPLATKDNRKRQYAPITVKGKEVGCLRKLESLECHFEGYSEYVEYLKSRDETQSLSRYQIAVGLLDDDYLFGRSKTIFLSNLSVNKDGDNQVMFPKDIQELNIYKCDDQPCHNLGRYPNQLGTSQVNMVREPVQPVVRDSSREALQRNGGAGASSSGGLTGNTNETSRDPLPTSLHVEVNNVAPQGQHSERVSGQPVVRGSSHERPLVNHVEHQEDSSQPTDPPCLTHGRYHDQLCRPLVNMVGDPGQPVVRDSSRNGDESGRDVFLTEELIGGEFENNKDAIWSWIMNDEASSSIGIYGMGGVGKTTLLTHIYNQLLQEPGTFRHVYWITLSQDFSVYRLQNIIAKHIHLDLSNEDNERKRAAKLSKALIGKQRWVLILDDLWNCFDFDKVGIPIQVKGCKLIVTTRSFEVCKRMVCQKTIKVDPLQMEEAWALFIKILGRIPPEVEEIAKSMARECAGLPLGIIIMAGTMRGVDDICEWRNALEELKQSRVWQEDMDEKVFHIMRFSFMYLKESELQQCFLCCALFPEDFEIPREDLIAYLIDEGVIKGLKSREAEFNKGHSMLNKLERVCLLESAKEGYYDDRCVKMHDLIRDMAIQILHENSQGMVKAGARLTEVPGAEEWTENLTRVSLMHNQIEEIPSTHSPRCPSLSTLLLCDNSQLQFIADLFFEQLHELKVLDLSRTNITKLPDSVSELVSLTTLLLSGCKMLRHVPSLEKLTALKRLDLSGTALEMMPQGMECLCNLRHLRMNGCGEKEFPRGLLPKLSHLQVFVLEWIPLATKDNRKRQYAPITVKGKEVGCLRKLESLECHFEGYSEYVEYLKSRDETQSLSRYQIAVGLLDDDYLFGRSKTIFLSNLSVNKDGDNQVMFPKDIQELNIYKCDDQPCHNLGRYPNQLGTSQVNMVREPVQPVVRDSSREALQRNGGAGASSSGGLTGNTNETSRDPLPTSLHVEVNNVAPQGQHSERVSGQPVVRGSSHERPLVNHVEHQEDSSQPTDPPCLTHGRYHDQLCRPLVNMVGDPGQPVVRDSSRNGDESGRDVFLTEELIGGEFENNKDAIWSWIMNDEASSSIGIYGMGGVGKTTLLTHIYNQLLQEPGTFRHVYWITLSQDFSVYRLQNIIAKHIHLDLSNEDNERKRAAKLSKALIGKQRWVLILDDLWNCFDFDKVGIPIQVKGCKLIVTTRSFEVCKRMVCQKTIKVDPLQMEEAWALFIKILGRIPPEVEEIAKSMARECAGLPLGIIIMAGTMRGVDDICEWRNALEELKQSRVWQEDMDEKVFHIMRFSFMYLKESELQQCFLCCALFPEDFEIPREDLIAYLIDEGVIKGLKSREAEFNKGHSMLNKLERVCLLESAKEGYYDDRCVKMHDLIRDMAIQILHENSQGMVKAGARLTEVPGAEEWTENLTRVSLMHNQIEEIPSTHSPRCPSLSTLLLCDNSQLQFIADLFFEQLHELKVLDLSRTNITKLPDSVSELVSLTTLLLSGCKMLRHVPSLEKLTALKRLDLSGTALEMMPQGMECLCNLRHLRMNGCGEKEFPRGLLPKLSHLQVFVLEEWIPAASKDNRKGQYAPITVKGKEVGCLRKLESLECHFEGYSEYVEYLKSRDETQSLSRYQIAVGLLNDDYLFGRSKTILLSNLSVNKDGDFQVMFPKDIQQLTIHKCDDATGDYMD